jgi:hypothetical protein
MAELLNKIPSNLTEYPNSFKRQGAFPLEAYSVFYTMDAARTYAASNPIAYVGQTLAVVTANATDPTKVDSVVFYVIADAAGTLQVVGKTYVGDEKSTHLSVDGETNIFSLKGFNEARMATFPQKYPIYKKDAEGNDTTEIDRYELRWITLEDIADEDSYSNYKASVVSNDDVRVVVDEEYDAETDMHTYKVSLNLENLEKSINDRFAGVTNRLDLADAGLAQEVSDREAAIAKEVEDRNAAIAVAKSAVETSLVNTKAALEQADADNLAEAKEYTDTRETAITTAYETLVTNTKTELQNQITSNDGDITALQDRATGLETRMGLAETAISANADAIEQEVTDRTNAISKEVTDRNTAIGAAKEEAVGFTAAQIKGLKVAIEGDYIVLKNANGEKIHEVDASVFVKDSFLEKVVYDSESGDIVFSFIGNENTEKLPDVSINVKDFVDIYTANESTGLHVENNKFYIDTDFIATASHVAGIKGAIEGNIALLTADTEEKFAAASSALEAAKAEINAEVNKKSDKTYVDTQLATKVDSATYEANRTADLQAHANDMAAHVLVMNEELGKKVDKETYAAEKQAHETAVATRNSIVDAKFEEVDEAIADLGDDLHTNYFTKDEINSKVTTINSNHNTLVTAVGELEEKVDANEADAENKISGLDSRVGSLEGSVVKKIKIGTEEFSPANNLVTVGIDKITSQINVGDLADGASYKSQVAAAIAAEQSARETADSTLTSNLNLANVAIGEHAEAIAANAAAIAANKKSADDSIAQINANFADHRDNVHAQVNSKIQALENTVNGVEGGSIGLRAEVTINNTDIAGLKTLTGTHTTQIASLTDTKADKTSVASDVENLTKAINTKLASSDFDTFKGLNDAAIADNKADIEAKLAAEKTAREAADAAERKYVDDNFYTKAAANGKFLATADYESRIQDDVLGIVDDAIGLADKEGGATVGTLVKLVEWVDEHVGDFAGFVTDLEERLTTDESNIRNNAEAIASNLAAIGQTNTNLGLLDAKVDANATKYHIADNTEIAADIKDTGTTLSIKEVNVNKLVQTGILVLDGGNSKKTVANV